MSNGRIPLWASVYCDRCGTVMTDEMSAVPELGLGRYFGCAWSAFDFGETVCCADCEDVWWVPCSDRPWLSASAHGGSDGCKNTLLSSVVVW